MSTIPNTPGAEPIVNYCQNCGKALTPPEVRTVGGHVYCEACLAQRLGIPAQPPAAGAQPYPAGMPPMPARHSPVLAAILGFIPGVGAMYNGQVAKGLVHVAVFIALVSAADHFGPFGMLVAAWIFYQVFDAYQTAYAMRYGMAVPDYLGLNNIAQKFGIAGATPGTPSQAQPYANYPPPPAPGVPPQAQGFAPPPPYVPQEDPAAYNPGMPGLMDELTYRSLPTGAIVLVALGVFFLLGTAGVLSTHWLHRGWPLILIVLGVYMIFSKGFRGGPQ